MRQGYLVVVSPIFKSNIPEGKVICVRIISHYGYKIGFEGDLGEIFSQGIQDLVGKSVSGVRYE